MRKDIQGRLDRLVAARHEQDAATVRQTISVFLEGMTPVELYECREPDALRPRLTDFLADQPPRLLATIERWSAQKGGK